MGGQGSKDEGCDAERRDGDIWVGRKPIYFDGTGGSGLVGGGPGHGGRLEVDIMQSVTKRAAIECSYGGAVKQ